MSAVEVRDRLGDRFRLLRGSERAAGAAADAATRGGLVVRPVDRRRARAAAQRIGLLRRVRPGGASLGGRRRRRRRRAGAARLAWSASRSWSSTTPPPTRDTACSRPSGSSPKSSCPTPAGSSGMRDRHAAHFAAEAVDCAGSTGTGPGWRDAVDWVEIELGNLRAAFRWSAQRGELEVATDIAAHAALMGFSVQLFETVGWAEELLPAATAADVRRLPRLYTAAGYACFVGRAEAAAANAHRATELETRPGYDPASPATRRSSRRSARSTAATSIATSSSPARWRRSRRRVAGYGIAAYVDGLQSAGRVDEALELADAAVAAARELGNPYWIAYTLWIVGLAIVEGRPEARTAAWDEGVELRARAPRQVLRGLHRPRRGASAHLRRRARGCPGAVRPRHRLVPPGWQRAAAHHHAGQRARALRTYRPPRAAATLLGAISRESASFHHVPELVDLGDRLARSSARSDRASSRRPGRRSTSTMPRPTRGSRSSSLASAHPAGPPTRSRPA